MDVQFLEFENLNMHFLIQDKTRCKSKSVQEPLSLVLLSKMRFISSQLNAYVSNDLWIRNASHANAMAKILSEGLNAFSNINLAYPTESNEVFVHLPRDVIDYLNNSGYDINEEELDGKAVRFVTAWNTDPVDVSNLLDKLSQKYG